MLKERGYQIGGVWAFDPYKIGKNCDRGQHCWVSLYEKHLSNVTWLIWNNQDPIPQVRTNSNSSNSSGRSRSGSNYSSNGGSNSSSNGAATAK